MHRIARRLGVLAAAFLAAACDRGPAPGRATSRDSAGITIVENAGPAWSRGAGWKVLGNPLVDIGGKRGTPPYELDQVRGPVRLSDDHLAIANASTNEIRFYDAAGKHLRSSGRAGNGPGEYSTIGGIWLGAGDSLLVDDVLIRRITLLDRDGNVGRSFSLGGKVGTVVPTNGRVELSVLLGRFADGTLAGVSQSLGINQQRAGVFRDSITIIRYGPDGGVLDTLGRFPGAEMEELTLKMGGRSTSSPSPVPLGRQTVAMVDRERLVVAQNNAWELELRGADGKLRALVRAPLQASRLTASDIAAHRKQQVQALEATPIFRNIPQVLKAQIKARAEQAKYPATLPFFAALLSDPDGNVWAEEASPPTQKAKRFDVVDSTGRWLGTVEFPADFRPTFIASDAVYGVWKDDEDVEHVRGYPLRKLQAR